MNINKRILNRSDDNIDELRQKYPNGLRFVVGDTHGEAETLKALMEKIKFDPEKDHVYFVGDYNEGGDIESLMEYLSLYYRAEYDLPGFHLLRGNHEREVDPVYPLSNLPDIAVLRGTNRNYYISHAGMVAKAFQLINADMAKNPQKNVYAYRMSPKTTENDGPLREVMWSRYGLYSQSSGRYLWPSQKSLIRNKACIIHGHSPYCYFKGKDRFTYGDNNLFFENQHIWFSEDLQSFNIDSNVKGRIKNGETYRGLACVCLEAVDEIAALCGPKFTVNGVRNGINAVFAGPLRSDCTPVSGGDIRRITCARPHMKTLDMDEAGTVFIGDQIGLPNTES